ncbi:MAG: hypothetical protein AVDCRST_MAG13-1628, partial [uncultured Solirubrobacteraceae bacterium]
ARGPRQRRHAADHRAVRHLRRDGPPLQGAVRPGADEGPEQLGRNRHPRRRARGHADPRRAQPRADGRAPAAARHPHVLPVRDGARVLRAGRAPHGAQGPRLHQRHRHRGGRPGHRALRPASRGLHGRLPHRALGAL